MSRRRVKPASKAGALWCVGAWLATLGAAPESVANPLLEELGRSESRVLSAAYPIRSGGSVSGYALGERLDRLGYRRVKAKPSGPGEYFWGHDVFWVYRRAHRLTGSNHKARLFGLRLDGERGADGGRILNVIDADGGPLDGDRAWIEPEILAESLDDDRARRYPFRLDVVPEHVWRPVLAAEDSRFFDHLGVDGRSVARALLANIKAGGVAQGGSTLTQQLIKNRDLTPERSLRRKASEAVRALTLEATHDKEDILEAYLDQVYLGHVDGLAVHGFGTASQVYFRRDVSQLSLHQAALLAAMIQRPNWLQPSKHPDRAKQRRDWVLGRMQELGWASEKDVGRAKRQPIRLRSRRPQAPLGGRFLDWVRETAEAEAGRRLRKGRGLVAETSLDPLLQQAAEDAVVERLETLRNSSRRLRDAPLSMALITLDATHGDVLAYVGGDPRSGGFDRVRSARRQPGSAVKPLVLLEAFEACGRREPLTPATRVADKPVRIELPSGPWQPKNSDGQYRGTVDVRTALRRSLNVPFARMGRHCGVDSIGRRLRRSGLDVPREPPMSLVLGAVETSPLELAAAYSTIAGGGLKSRPRPVLRLEKPGGWILERFRVKRDRVTSPATAFLVHDLLRDAVRDGTAGAANLEGLAVAAKTGTSQDRRDAWLAGYASGLVTVVWVGRDDDRPLGLTGAQAAAPLWRAFMEKATDLRPPSNISRPSGVVTRHVDPTTGLRVIALHPRAEAEIFRRGALPPRDRWLKKDQPVPVLE
ncbi:MAG: transglycosylase domain-containing protein [Acidobacteriota bacterium]